MPEQRVVVRRPVTKRALPPTPSETETETDSETVTSYCSTCTQTTASTNIIDDRNRVIHRRVVKNPRVLHAVIEKPPRNKLREREYVKPIENSMETKQYLIKKHLTDSAKFQNNGTQYSNYENVNVVRKPGRRPGSASSRNFDEGQVVRRVIRRVEREEPQRVVVVRRPVVSEREGRVVRRIITRSRPSSYNGRDGGEPIIIRRERPSSYHAGMAKEYEQIQQDETSATEDETERVVREYRLQNNETRAVKQLEGDRWVDEYDVPDKEVRNVGVQMTTNYVVPKPPEKESRTIGTQTKQKTPREPTPPPPREPTPPPPRVPTPPPAKPKKKKKKTVVAPPPPPPPRIKTPEPEPEPVKVKPKLPPPLPVIYRRKARHQYVRVGGGWMKIDHYRNHHVPLKDLRTQEGGG
uniref:GAR domain-containing protein n=1 Tax=Magallana gigas TaxID=29159 RepID=A0A8W8MNL1_MAGGI